MAEQSIGVQEIANRKYIGPNKTGDNIDADRVANYETIDGMTWERAGTKHTERYDYSSSTTVYTALAPLGTSEGSTGWVITKYDLSNSSNASGKVATDVSWTGRAGGTYA